MTVITVTKCDLCHIKLESSGWKVSYLSELPGCTKKLDFCCYHHMYEYLKTFLPLYVENIKED